MKPEHVTSSAQTLFGRPRASEQSDYAQPVPMSPTVARSPGDDGSEVRKRCNFVFLPGVLFNRPIGNRIK